MMTDKDALIEQLAERRFGTGFGSFSYAELTEHGKEQYRALVRQDWPLIVAFVETWIERDGRFDDEAVERAERWNCEMTDA